MTFKNLHVFNLALLGKIRWRLIKELNSLVYRMFKAKYFAICDFLSSSIGRNSSYTWQSIWTARNVIRKGMIGIVLLPYDRSAITW